ncbi:hypothetical protein [Actinomadura oligospora]|uniref:hypothetical protein n=1 Tax=Actinomadura oligospora TaxID=111804 RepID=UPI00047AD047|nr:hypothetical protein [Actinomadura oligospora]
MNRRHVLIGAATGAVLALGAFTLLPDGPEDHLLRVPRVAGDQLQSSPVTPTSGLVWRDFHGFRLPYSASDGPNAVADDRAAGFARSPLGALLAAIHVSVRSDPRWGLATATSTVNTQFVGPDRAGMLASINTAPLAPGTPHAYATLEAFRWQGYTPETASVDVVSAGPGDSDQVVRAATRIQLQWQDGDWRVVAPPGGTWLGSAAPVGSLDGYTRFPTAGEGGR